MMAADDGTMPISFQELIDQGVLDIGDGYRAKNRELGGDGLIFLRAGHVGDSHIEFDGVDRFDAALDEKLQHKMAHPGDTVVTTKGNSTGRTSFVTPDMPPFVYSPHLSYWRSLDERRLASGFLRYWSRSKEFANQLTGMKASTDMAPYLSLTDQRRLRISLPDIVQQNAVAKILGDLDDKIEVNRRMNETLEAMARAIFKSWFVDFDPDESERNGETTRTVQQWIDAGDLLIGDGYRAKRSELGEPGLPFVRAGNLQDMGFKFSNAEILCDASVIAAKEKVSEPYDVAFTSKGTVGRMTLVSKHTPRFVYSPQVCWWRVTNNDAINPHVLYRWMESAEFMGQVGRVKGQTDMADYVSLRDQRAMQFTLPPMTQQKLIADELKNIDAMIASNIAESETLAQTRDSLLPKLLSGILSVSNERGHLA